MSKIKTAAIITINNPGLMTKMGRRRIATWLKKQADDFESLGKELGNKKFIIRYRY